MKNICFVAWNRISKLWQQWGKGALAKIWRVTGCIQNFPKYIKWILTCRAFRICLTIWHGPGKLIFEEKKHLKNDQKLWSTLGMTPLWIGGGLIWSCLLPGIFGAVLCIKARKFLNLVSYDVWPHVREVWKFENPHCGAKNQSCQKYMVWPIKTCARRAESKWKKIQLNQTYRFWEKAKNTRKQSFPRVWYF